MRLIVASSSPNRRNLFDKLGIAYEMVSPQYEEIIDKNQTPENQIQAFALGKAESVYDQLSETDDTLVLGFDSMISFEGTSIGKPKTKKDAFAMLQSFIGKPQQIMTGVAMLGNFRGKFFSETFYQATDVQFRSDTTDDALRSYLEFGDWEGKCGAYSILGTGIWLLESINGDFQNIIGVPVLNLSQKIREILGVSPWEVFVPKS